MLSNLNIHPLEFVWDLKPPAVECLTIGLSRGMNGVSALCSSIELPSETEVSNRLGMSGGYII